MRMLWVKAGKLLPVDTGGRIRSYNILKHLAARHETTLLSYHPGGHDATYADALEREFPRSVAIGIGGADGVAGEALRYARAFAGSTPYSVTKYTSPLVRRALTTLIAERAPDVLVCDFLAASGNFPRELPKPAVLFQHNVESALWRRQAQFERNPVKKIFWTAEAAKMLRYERAAIERFHHVVAVSEHDRAQMLELNARAAVTVVPTGVDVAQFRRPPGPATQQPTVMFLGSMDWPANIDGVLWFCEEVWPRVIDRVPSARFSVVGRNPPPRIQRLASDSVIIQGGVPSVLPHLHAASVFVVPLRIGGGTRLKIYEAMAAGLPMVSTTVGAEGLDVTHGRDILLADDATTFGDAVVSLLLDDAARTRIGAEAVATASRFDWSVIATDFERVLEIASSRV